VYPLKQGECSDSKEEGRLLGEVKNNILYIKLASNSGYATTETAIYDEDKAIGQEEKECSNPNPMPFSVQKYQKSHPKFPHESTADIYYSKEQFRAYRDLGVVLTESAIKFTDFFETK
jgi:hypothetical protein